MKIPSLTTEQMVEIDRLMIEVYGIDLTRMMENAGSNLARLALRLCRTSSAPVRISVLCGAGNNGGGGMVAARHLHNRGANVNVILVSAVEKLKKIPAQQWHILKRMGITEDRTTDLSQYDLIIDAMVGYGMQGVLRDASAEWTERVNASGRDILSLDAPSGLDTTTGAVKGQGIHACATMTLALPKIGLQTKAARRYVGELYLADISVPPELYIRLGLVVPPLFQEDTILRLE
jgi:NAD(P)H-hydrate epimerase